MKHFAAANSFHSNSKISYRIILSSAKEIFFDELRLKIFVTVTIIFWCNIRCCRKCAVCWKADNDYVQKPKDQHDVIG